MKKAIRTGGDLIHRGREHHLVCLRRFGETANLANELQRGVANFLRGYRGIEIKQRLDIPAHGSSPQSEGPTSHYSNCWFPRQGMVGLDLCLIPWVLPNRLLPWFSHSDARRRQSPATRARCPRTEAAV